MTTSFSNQMTITDFGLNKISEKIISEREFNESKITISGNPIVTENGVLSSLSETRGASYEGLSFSEDDTVTISAEGNIEIPEGDEVTQCFWNLTGNNGTSIFLELRGAKLALIYKYAGTTRTLFESEAISNLKGSPISASIQFNKNSCDIAYTIGPKSESLNLSITPQISINNFNTILIGNDVIYEEGVQITSHNYWRGSLKLTKFLINKNSSLYYTPSDAIVFEFSKLLISDGTYPLTDNSHSINRKVYEFPLEEVTSSGNNILVKTTISKEASLTIREIGLYIQFNGSPKLFSIIKNLNIDKTTELGYDLIFHINVDLDIVNVSAFPTIIITGDENVSKKDFIGVLETTSASISDVEVASAKNATEIGYNKAQVFYEYSNKLNLVKDNWLTTWNYNKLKSGSDMDVEDYVHFPYMPYNSYSVKNLKDMSKFKVLGTAFKGSPDSIDFNYSVNSTFVGCSMSTKVLLENLEDRLLLIKRGDETYFLLEIKDGSIKFSLSTTNPSQPVVLSYLIPDERVAEFISNPFLLTITVDGDSSTRTFSMYKNNELLLTNFLVTPSLLSSPEDYILYNYLNDESMNEATLCLVDIISFKGCLSREQIYYLTNLTDTSF